MLPASFTVTVGNNPDTVSLVGRANVASWYAMPLRIIPDLGQVPENVAKPSTKQSWGVFQQRVFGFQLANEPPRISPKPTSGIGKAKAFSGD